MTASSRKKPDLRIVDHDQAAADIVLDGGAPAIEPVRPVLLESASFLSGIRLIRDERAGDIDLIDAAEAKADADLAALIKRETAKRDAIRRAQQARRSDLMLIIDGCDALFAACARGDGEFG